MLKVKSVTKGSQAEKNGVEEGDLILEVNGIEISSPFKFKTELAKSKNEIILTVLRSDKVKFLELKAHEKLGFKYLGARKTIETKYELNVDFLDVFLFLILWVILTFFTLGLATPFFLFYLIRFIVNNTASHQVESNKFIESHPNVL